MTILIKNQVFAKSLVACNSFICQLDWAMVPPYLVKCYSWHFCKGVFGVRLTFKLLDFE